jgi:acyl-CoA synthetase (NDP forming)
MDAEEVRKLIEVGVESNEVGSFVVVLQGEILGSFVEPLKNIDYKGKPVMACVACKEFSMDDVIKMEQAGIPVYSTSEFAIEVLGDMYRYGLSRAK